VQLNDTTTATEYTKDADLSLRSVCHGSVKLLIEYIYQRLSKQSDEEPSLLQSAVFSAPSHLATAYEVASNNSINISSTVAHQSHLLLLILEKNLLSKHTAFHFTSVVVLWWSECMGRLHYCSRRLHCDMTISSSFIYLFIYYE